MSLGLFACGACGAGWIAALAWRAPEGALRAAARGLLGGLSAFLVAWGGYALLEHRGMRVSWAEVSAGGSGGVALAGAIGLIEESAKLFGMSLASVGTRRAGSGLVVRTVLAVSASFATLECATVLRDADPILLVLRSSLAPVAHAVLAAPLGLVLGGGARGIRWTLPALLLSATLHGAADLSLATPEFGRLGYAAVLAAPAVFLHLWARRASTR
ncbi:MAG TPA: hypothetical protein VFG53_12215 [Anaeromyxobacter sp.]|nr:hypothetical protein [Anaeromyxobacter sp.]